MLCRDKCGYCTFAQPPARLESPYLDPDAGAGHRPGRGRGRLPRGAVHARRAARGALPGRPRAWLADHGYDSTVDYLAAMAQLVLDETGLLPHANAGALFADELAALRAGRRRRQGMMIESLNPDLDVPPGRARQDARARAWPRSRPPASWPSRSPPASSSASASPAPTASTRSRPSPQSHRRHGHVQEVIVQNFLPKPGTAMHHAPPCPHRRLPRGHRPGPADPAAPTSTCRRRRTSPTTSACCSTPASTTGAASRPSPPTTSTPSGPGPPSTACARSPRRAGFTPRAPAHRLPRVRARPRAAGSTTALRFPVLDRTDAEGLGRDDPGAVFVQRITPASPSRSTTAPRCSTSATAPRPGTPAPTVDPPRARARPRRRAGGAVAEVLAGVLLGQELGVDEIVTLFAARGPEVAAVAEVADELRRAARSATWSPSSATATSTTRTSARSSASSAASRRARCRSTSGARPTCSPSTTSPSGSARPPSSAPPRSACRAASTPTSTATTTSTSPGP